MRIFQTPEEISGKMVAQLAKDKDKESIPPSVGGASASADPLVEWPLRLTVRLSILSRSVSVLRGKVECSPLYGVRSSLLHA